MTFLFTDEDNNNIQLAMSLDKPWESSYVENLKTRIKRYYRDNDNSCCYCKKNFIGEFNLVIDIEHILPKSSYAQFIFELKNLSIACKRCNMNIKGNAVNFLHDDFDHNSPFVSIYYLIIHPNLDIYYEHMNRIVHEVNDFKLIKYNPIDDKGKFSYTFFKLKELEIEQIDNAQGLKIEKTDSLPVEMQKFINNIQI